jgi:hypothetical protein
MLDPLTQAAKCREMATNAKDDASRKRWLCIEAFWRNEAAIDQKMLMKKPSAGTASPDLGS